MFDTCPLLSAASHFSEIFLMAPPANKPPALRLFHFMLPHLVDQTVHFAENSKFAESMLLFLLEKVPECSGAVSSLGLRP